MERHWKSVVFLLVPVMTFGWLVTSLFVWWMVTPLSWLESLVVAACVTATDPVLASSVVGKGKLASPSPLNVPAVPSLIICVITLNRHARGVDHDGVAVRRRDGRHEGVLASLAGEVE
ncbi:hypothetical protein CONLIGDRAFT_699730 [Coniochaeta ligniaria NRRL 30616]|uniref:Cation/H+ exchanger transmembrane domain-containing protein n=1 Tax=Coniochaeta ligniaria NRRL 30616 TaxID=1408157 RepID=A0A1J7IZI3_9PEZI|nr:hypothetical protein CONLIGDRAFT_699730 [Coniochaeta ligniaria NRRL 30616]